MDRGRLMPPLGLVVFVVGISTLGAEIAAARLLAPYFGASTIVWANTIGIVLVALSIGYWYGGRIADRDPSFDGLLKIVLLGAVLVGAVPFVADPFLEVAVDALDEWLELASLPLVLDRRPERRAVLGPGRTVHLHATDTPAALDAEWVVDLTGDVPTWRRAHEKSAVAVRGPLTGLVLLVYGRRAIDQIDAEVFGDRDLLDAWLAANPFG